MQSTDVFTGSAFKFMQQSADGGWIDVDTAELDHIVTAAGKTCDALKVDATGRIGRQKAGHILCVKTYDGIDRVLKKHCHADITGFARVDWLS